MQLNPFWMSTGYTLTGVAYLILGIITAILCYRESRKQKNYSYEWVMFGYLLPILPYLLLKGKK
jgi:hypothetical protein